DRRHEITFSWAIRYEVALGVAGAVDYLHNGAGESIIHRDVKSSNILLTDAFGAQVFCHPLVNLPCGCLALLTMWIAPMLQEPSGEDLF
ncbi:hypothetical protein RJ640_027012, partial [Escallonia rubra]